MITQDTDFYADITQYIYAKGTHLLRKSFKQNTQLLRKYVYAVITQLSQIYAIILCRYYADSTMILRKINYAIITHITQSLRK